MIEPNMRVLVRGDKPDQEIIGQVVRVITADDLAGEVSEESRETREHMQAMHITHVAAIMTPASSGTITLFKIILRNGEWYLMNGEHLTLEIVGVHRG